MLLRGSAALDQPFGSQPRRTPGCHRDQQIRSWARASETLGSPRNSGYLGSVLRLPGVAVSAGNPGLVTHGDVRLRVIASLCCQGTRTPRRHCQVKRNLIQIIRFYCRALGCFTTLPAGKRTKFTAQSAVKMSSLPPAVLPLSWNEGPRDRPGFLGT
eukprot:184265-Rhodomonas_salina.1